MACDLTINFPKKWGLYLRKKLNKFDLFENSRGGHRKKYKSTKGVNILTKGLLNEATLRLI
jgi:hypothetical protein